MNEKTVGEAIQETTQKIGMAIEESNLDILIVELILKDFFNQVQLLKIQQMPLMTPAATNKETQESEGEDTNGEH